MRAPHDDAAHAGDVRLARDEIADAAFVEAARVVDDQDIAGRRCRDGFQKYVGAAAHGVQGARVRPRGARHAWAAGAAAPGAAATAAVRTHPR